MTESELNRQMHKAIGPCQKIVQDCDGDNFSVDGCAYVIQPRTLNQK
jgi:hypothetical protein